MRTRLAFALLLLVLLFGLSANPAYAGLTGNETQALRNALNSIKQSDLPDSIKNILPRVEDVTASDYEIPKTGLTLHTYSHIDVQGVAAVVALTGIPDMALFGTGLKAPVLFWVGSNGSDFTLKTEKMTAPLRTYVVDKLKMPTAVVAATGLNVFGRFGVGVADDWLQTVTNYKLENFLVGLAKMKEQADKQSKGKDDKPRASGYVMTLAMASQTPWNNPFGLADTTIKGGTLRSLSIKETQMRWIEAWGTAAVGKDAKELTFYVRNQYQKGVPTSQSLGFDAYGASLKDFFTVLGVVGKTLDIPVPTTPNFTLNLVTLRNPAWRSSADPSAPLNFDTMMFKGTREATGVGDLTVNAAGSIFGQPVAAIELSASKKDGVVGKGAMNAAIGPLKAASAGFYLTATTTAAPSMGLKVKASIFGDLDLKAGTDGLKLAVPASCPLRPIGLTATLTDIGPSITDFPVTASYDDCAIKVLTDFADGIADTADLAAGGAIEAGRATATTAANIAKGLSDSAATAIAAADQARFTAWEAELKRVRLVTDASAEARKAFNAADGLVNSLGGEIQNLGKEIEQLGKDIANLLKAVFTLDWDKITSKRNEKANKESQRDTKVAQKAAAERVRDQARVASDNAGKAATEVVGPNVSGEVVAKSSLWLGARATKDVQDRTQAYATALADDLRDGNKRKAVLAAVDKTAFIAERKTALAADYGTLSKVQADLLTEKDGKRPIERLLTSAKRDMISQAVAKSIENDAAAWLSEMAVSSLPTIEFDVPINILIVNNAGNRKCLALEGFTATIKAFSWQDKTRVDNQPCVDKDETAQNGAKKSRRTVFTLSAGGLIRSAADRAKCLSLTMAGAKDFGNFMYYLEVVGCDQAERLFFDPADGTLRYLVQGKAAPFVNGLYCLHSPSAGIGWTNSVVWGSPCGNNAYEKYDTRWLLVGAGGQAPTSATGIRKVAGKGMAAPSNAAVTNLAPLRVSR